MVSHDDIDRGYLYPFETGIMPETPAVDIPAGEKNWLEDALPMNVYNSTSYRFRRMVDYIFRKLVKRLSVSNKHRAKEALKTILINLWLAYNLDMPVRYFRNKNRYTRNARYGRLFFKYDRIIPVIDALGAIGYIQQKVGIFNSDKGFGRQTRMWCNPKLLRYFQYFSLITKDFYQAYRPEELIVLRDNNEYKSEMPYRETPLTGRQRENLERYNDFVEQHEITVNLDDATVVDKRFLLRYLYSNILNNKIILNEVILKDKPDNINPDKTVVQSYNNLHNVVLTGSPINNKIIDIINSYTTMTNTIRSKRLMDIGLRDSDDASKKFLHYLYDLRRSIKDCEDVEEALSEKLCIGEIGIDELVFRLVYEYLHRVYNRRSFKLGGRAYGALHQSLPKKMRPQIFINGNPTVEVDYSAYHIRMLYHKEGMEFREDAYSICGGPEMRDQFKAVALIAINAKDDRSAYGAIRKEFIERGIPFPTGEKPLVRLVETFRLVHHPIEKYLFSDIGIHLQNKDSDIMDNILMKLIGNGILGLSVHDSVIVDTKYEEDLRKTMEREYETVMNYKPMF